MRGGSTVGTLDNRQNLRRLPSYLPYIAHNFTHQQESNPISRVAKNRVAGLGWMPTIDRDNQMHEELLSLPPDKRVVGHAKQGEVGDFGLVLAEVLGLEMRV